MPPAKARKNDGVRKVPIKSVPMVILSNVTVIPALRPKRTITARVIILERPNLNQGKGVGKEDSIVCTTIAREVSSDR